MDKNIIWLWFNETVKITRRKKRELYRVFGSVEKIYGATRSELGEVEFLTEADKTSLCDKDTHEASATFEKIKEFGARLITIDNEDYPVVLREIDDPPCVLYAKGINIDLNQRLCIAVVGTRKATPYGKTISFNLAKSLAGEGVVIVSGLAMGVDARAHEGALSARGYTVAVLGCGLDVVYPASNAGLMREIFARGLVVTEYPFGTRPERYHFPERNRIISGLSQGTLVTEADVKSGSLITAGLAQEQGRDVFSVPGNINSLFSLGTNLLIKDGARVATTDEDILSCYRLDYPERLMIDEKPLPEEEDPEEEFMSRTDDIPKKILMVLKDNGKVHIDEICTRCKLVLSDAETALMLMEIRGSVIRHPGGFFEKNN